MFPIRIKLGPARNNEWRCCFCLHVRTATILLGIWHLVIKYQLKINVLEGQTCVNFLLPFSDVTCTGFKRTCPLDAYLPYHDAI